MRAGREDVQHAGRLRAERGFVLPGLDAAHAGAGGDFVETDFDQPGTAGPRGVVVAIAMLAGDDQLVGKSVAVRQSLHARDVVTA